MSNWDSSLLAVEVESAGVRCLFGPIAGLPDGAHDEPVGGAENMDGAAHASPPTVASLAGRLGSVTLPDELTHCTSGRAGP